jgi:hypothetical protein
MTSKNANTYSQDDICILRSASSLIAWKSRRCTLATLRITQ